VEIVREKAFTMWTIPALDTVAHDVRYGLRMIAKSRCAANECSRED
jgi:hypothetical protein